MLHDSWLLEGFPNVAARNLHIAPGFARIIQQNAVADDVGLALGEVAPATKADQRTAIACLGRYQEGEYNANEECEKSLD